MTIVFTERLKSKKRSNDYVPGVLYGPGIENLVLEVDRKNLEKSYNDLGESSLVFLESGKNKYRVLIHDIQKDPLTGRIIHVDFYQPDLKEEVEVTVPLVFEGEAPAVKELGGTLVKNILEVEVKALPEKLPHNIKVSVEGLKTFEDAVLVKDLQVEKGVKVMKDSEEIVVSVTPIEDIDKDLETPIDEDVDAVGKVEEKKEKEELEENDKEEK